MKIEVVGECIDWTGSITREGYGRIMIDYKQYFAHRLAYSEAYGPIPDGLTVDHLRFNRRCVNPLHLRLLTFGDNGANTREAYKTHCCNGHEFTPENTYLRPDVKYRRAQRGCRTCRTAAGNRYKAKMKGIAA